MSLTQERAEARGLAIKHGSIVYDFHISLEKGNNYYGFSEISFDLNTIPQELPLDFNGKVTRFVVNGSAFEIKTE